MHALNISDKCVVLPGVELPIKEKTRVPGNYRFLDYYAKDDISVT